MHFSPFRGCATEPLNEYLFISNTLALFLASCEFPCFLGGRVCVRVHVSVCACVCVYVCTCVFGGLLRDYCCFFRMASYVPDFPRP